MEISLEKFWEIERAYMDAVGPFLDLMDEVKRRVGDDAHLIEESLLGETFIDYWVDPIFREDEWLEFVNAEGKPAFRLPKEMLEAGIDLLTDYATNPKHPLSFTINCYYKSDSGKEIRAGSMLLWKPEEGRFEVLLADIEFMDGEIEVEGIGKKEGGFLEGYMPRWVYERFLKP